MERIHTFNVHVHIHQKLIRIKYNKLYQNPTPSLKSYWQLGCQDTLQIGRLNLSNLGEK